MTPQSRLGKKVQIGIFHRNNFRKIFRNTNQADDIPDCPVIDQRTINDGIKPKFELNPEARFSIKKIIIKIGNKSLFLIFKK